MAKPKDAAARPPDTGRWFSRFAAAAMRQRGVTGAWVATQLRVEYATFRSWLQRNTVPEPERKKLLTLLRFEVPPDCVLTTRAEEPKSNDYRFSTRADGLSLAATLDRIEARRRKLEAEAGRLADGFPAVLSAMGRNDLSVFTSSTVTPIEQQTDAGEEITQAVANALYAGATFLYVRPDAKYLRKLRHDWRYDRVPDDEDVREDFARMRRRLLRVLAAGEYDDADVQASLDAAPDARPSLGPDEAEQRLRDQLIQIRVPECPLWAAGFAVGLLQTTDLTGATVRCATVRLPGSGKVLVQPRDYTLFVDRLTKFALAVTVGDGRYQNTDWKQATTQRVVGRVHEQLSRGGASE